MPVVAGIPGHPVPGGPDLGSRRTLPGRPTAQVTRARVDNGGRPHQPGAATSKLEFIVAFLLAVSAFIAFCALAPVYGVDSRRLSRQEWLTTPDR